MMEPHEMELLGCYSRNPDNKPLKKALKKVSLPKEKTEYPNLKHSYNLRVILLREFSPLRKELGCLESSRNQGVDRRAD